MCWPAAGSRKLPQAVRLWDLGKEGKVKGGGALVLPSALVPLGKVSEWSGGGLSTLHPFQNILFWTARQPEGSLALVAVTAALHCKTPLAQLCQMLGRSGVRPGREPP